MKRPSGLLAAVAVFGLITALPVAHADTKGGHKSGVSPVNNDAYAKECSACHFAYPPGLMSAASWQKLFSNLGDHFGENAELPGDTVKALTDYATANAADKSGYGVSARIMRTYGKATPMRISEVPYIQREHREIINRYVKNNPKVGSLSKCEACHTQAQKGSFAEGEINIPGHGKVSD